MDYNNFTSSDKKILIDSNIETINITNNFDLNKSEILINSSDSNEVNLLNNNFLDFIEKINFVKKNIINKKIIESLNNNITNLTNLIDEYINQIDEQVISLGIINKNRNNSIEIQFN